MPSCNRENSPCHHLSARPQLQMPPVRPRAFPEPIKECGRGFLGVSTPSTRVSTPSTPPTRVLHQSVYTRVLHQSVYTRVSTPSTPSLPSSPLPSPPGIIMPACCLPALHSGAGLLCGVWEPGHLNGGTTGHLGESTFQCFSIWESPDDKSSLDSVSATTTKSECWILCPDPDGSVARRRRGRK